ncbi:hypothetical protein HELRODRAFT_161597 [Helobdella robusta]|uniref:Uncharacterized protein n=1 Tax=Helobdella robusta TaxID=6412 RepID=T1ERP1_HELRO|nr:hypothetical protein HELRODRAFT_161597 [Helobdella robusta]ESO02340.1 hypothetical protein HELRODRAFT_161597 [Helobdella robusta]
MRRTLDNDYPASSDDDLDNLSTAGQVPGSKELAILPKSFILKLYIGTKDILLEITRDMDVYDILLLACKVIGVSTNIDPTELVIHLEQNELWTVCMPIKPFAQLQSLNILSSSPSSRNPTPPSPNYPHENDETTTKDLTSREL